MTQTIVNGSTIANLNNWRAVYDANGDKVEDDPGSIQFLVDGNQVLSEINPPFGDTFANGTITVGNGTHTFQVRAQRQRHLLATNTLTATVGTATPAAELDGRVTQTIANGSTMSDPVGWRGVYDENGDKVEDDPGRSSSSSTASRCSPRSTRRSATPTTSARPPSPTAPHLPGARRQRQRHPPRHQHRHRHRQNSRPTAADLDGRVTQTIVNGSTMSDLNNWRGVYDENGDKVEDDPGSIQFLVDGNQVLSEINPPFGDTYDFGTPPSATAPTPSRCAPSTTAAPCSPPTPSPPPSTTRHHRGHDGSDAAWQPRVASASPTGAAISWTAATDNVGIAGYGLYAIRVVGTTPQTTATFNSLTCGTGYPVASTPSTRPATRRPPRP